MVLYDETHLIFKHFPNELSDEDKVDFLKHFGAVDVKILPRSNKKGNICFARFSSKDVAKEVVLKLHQVELLGQLLSVEFVRGSDLNTNVPSFVQTSSTSLEKDKYYEQFLTRLNSWTNVVDFHHPPPVHLRYSYPAPNIPILTNICRALYSVPKLYTQVLHLMNKMNLPCPLLDNFPIDCELYVTDSLKTEISDDESEIEGEQIEKEILPQNLLNKKIKMRKRPTKLIKPFVKIDYNPKTTVQTSEIFETKDINVKKIELKVSSDLSSLKELNQQVSEIVEFEKLDVPEKKSDENLEEEDETYEGKVISEEELSSNRISTKDQRMLPVFKNYHCGTPSCRLYIKNLAKNTVVDELHYIYRRYYQEREDEQGVMYDIRLMQEGRMKGQAFVTLQCVEQAQKALDETNGFILHGKPMVVQFARSAKQKTDEKMDVDT